MRPLHSIIKRVLLVGVTLPDAQPVVNAPPERLRELIAASAASHGVLNARAIDYGNRYRSAFWSIYLLSAIAVLFAALPPALGWDVHGHALNGYTWLWGVAELVVIGVVGLVYWLGERGQWQAEWLAARTQAELTWYLPLVAPLVDFSEADAGANWYARLFDPGQHLREESGVDALCAQLEPLARASLAGAWQDAAFLDQYARWAISILDGQRVYHARMRAEHHALLHRVHRVTGWLFALTAVGAALHLVLHSLWLSLLAVFFPALAAALHGALAQSEAFRLEQSAGRLVETLAQAINAIEQARALPGDSARQPLADAIQAAAAVILDEHQDWHGTVRPHQIPLG
jgi:hypothetical protein